MFEKTFSNYRVWLYMSYLNIGALNDSSSISLGTSPMQIDGELVDPFTPMPKASVDVAGLEGAILDLKELCAMNLMVSLINRGKLPPQFANMPLWFYSTPENLSLGRKERNEPVYVLPAHFM